jgi:hypothetical protein
VVPDKDLDPYRSAQEKPSLMKGYNMTKYARIKRSHGRTVWFDGEVLVKVEAEARKKGKGFSTWVYEVVRREILPKSRNL